MGRSSRRAQKKAHRKSVGDVVNAYRGHSPVPTKTRTGRVELNTDERWAAIGVINSRCSPNTGRMKYGGWPTIMVALCTEFEVTLAPMRDLHRNYWGQINRGVAFHKVDLHRKRKGVCGRSTVLTEGLCEDIITTNDTISHHRGDQRMGDQASDSRSLRNPPRALT